MLRMDQFEFVWTAHKVYGKSISELSRITGLTQYDKEGGVWRAVGIQRTETLVESVAGQVSRGDRRMAEVG